MILHVQSPAHVALVIHGCVLKLRTTQGVCISPAASAPQVLAPECATLHVPWPQCHPHVSPFSVPTSCGGHQQRRRPIPSLEAIYLLLSPTEKVPIIVGVCAHACVPACMSVCV